MPTILFASRRPAMAIPNDLNIVANAVKGIWSQRRPRLFQFVRKSPYKHFMDTPVLLHRFLIMCRNAKIVVKPGFFKLAVQNHFAVDDETLFIALSLKQDEASVLHLCKAITQTPGFRMSQETRFYLLRTPDCLPTEAIEFLDGMVSCQWLQDNGKAAMTTILNGARRARGNLDIQTCMSSRALNFIRLYEQRTQTRFRITRKHGQLLLELASTLRLSPASVSSNPFNEVVATLLDTGRISPAFWTSLSISPGTKRGIMAFPFARCTPIGRRAQPFWSTLISY